MGTLGTLGTWVHGYIGYIGYIGYMGTSPLAAPGHLYIVATPCVRAWIRGIARVNLSASLSLGCVGLAAPSLSRGSIFAQSTVTEFDPQIGHVEIPLTLTLTLTLPLPTPNPKCHTTW